MTRFHVAKVITKDGRAKIMKHNDNNKEHNDIGEGIPAYICCGSKK